MTAFPPQPAFGTQRLRSLFRIALTLLAMFAIAVRPSMAQSILRDAEPVAANGDEDGVGPDGEPRRGWWQRTFGN